MTDMTQGQDAPNENALFNDAVSTTTLEKFENPEPVAPDKPQPDKVTEPPKPEAKPDDNAPVPAGRMREEAELRRRAERERDDLQRRLDALMVRQPPQPQTPPQAIDYLDNPKGFVQAELKPILEQMRAEFQTQREAMSLDNARTRYGYDKVDAAYQALSQGMSRGDPSAKAMLDQAMASHDPYGMITRWHQQNETLRVIGPDPEAYRKRILEEALSDPEYRKRVIEAAKSQAAASGNTVARPVVASSPSLANIGGGGGDQQVIEPSDEELFRAATQAKRR